ncbi:MAG: T9SS type A sorting domain-containing protein [Saprospiraceae bacterium]|nr:T9SS type A sorting domain-containing protein [Candidatus Opimibacter skivensis]MBP6679570.1 T9SS type A sorting domain-containing protein [Saprospiraceae bacterium]MBP8085717.1 T9SS type A sorting domain-containing protein [Saprospiraceae bacterium]
MNTLYHVIVILLLSVMAIPDASSQNEIGFLDSTFVWTENHQYQNGSESFKYTIDAIPTTFSNRTYYEVLQTTDELSEDWGGTGDFIRQENKIIYLYQNPVDAELYNFNLLVGDTVKSDITMVVDSIDTYTLLTGEQRNRWNLRCIYDDPETAIFTEWVEGIGDINGLFAENSQTNCSADADGSVIMCMFRNDTLLYDHPDINGCWFLPVATTEIKNELVFLAPNPADESIRIEGLDTDVLSVQVFSALGNLLYQGNENRIDLGDFPPGYYYAAILLNEHQYMIKGFLKQ